MMNDSKKTFSNPSGGAIEYLRVSITDRCNLRCIYCMPPEGVTPAPHESILRYEEIYTLVKAGVLCGIRKVRVTGGEPLIRRDVTKFIASLNKIPDLEEITITTNGVSLCEYAADLKAAGVSRINISLDTLDREKFARITRRDSLDDVLRGIDTVLELGFDPVKINVVAMKGLNDDEIGEFGKLTIDRPLHVRFIEFMSLGGLAHRHSGNFFPADMVKQSLEAVGPLTSVSPIKGNGPARYFTYPGAVGTVGLISPLSHGFCEMCNRLRVTADGRLRPCLLSDVELDAKSVLRSNGGAAAVENLFRQALAQKTYKLEMNNSNHRSMRSIGG